MVARSSTSSPVGVTLCGAGDPNDGVSLFSFTSKAPWAITGVPSGPVVVTSSCQKPGVSNSRIVENTPWGPAGHFLNSAIAEALSTPGASPGGK